MTRSGLARPSASAADGKGTVMDVTVIGCGYVGLVTATCLASIGHTVRGVEKDQKKLKTLQDGHCPIFEPGLQELMQEHYAAGSLQFTDNVKARSEEHTSELQSLA